MPGDPLRVSVESAAPLAELTLTLVLGDGTRVTGRAFTVDAEPLGTRWAAVMGIPSTAPATMAQLLISGRPAGDGEPEEVRLLLSQPLRIVPRAFMAEDIPLSAELSALRRTTDPRREEESRDLWRLLTTWRPVAHPHLGPLRLPLGDVRRTSGFGDRRRYLYDDGSIDNAIHHGVDFASPAGTAVAAAGAGTVVMARPRIVTGLTVVIEHLPGVYSLYYHLARLAVQEGQRVSAGDPLGTVGSTGLATGPHLHWEVRAAGVPVDPDAVVAGPLVDLPGRARTVML